MVLKRARACVPWVGMAISPDSRPWMVHAPSVGGKYGNRTGKTTADSACPFKCSMAVMGTRVLLACHQSKPRAHICVLQANGEP